MSFGDWQAVTQPKIQGTWNLHNVSMDLGLDLDFFLLFSSWSGLVGQWGQANYAAGNSFLDSFAQFRRNMMLPASTVDIGIMEDIGYVSRNAHVLEHFRTTSTHVLYEQDLLDSLHLMIKRGLPASSDNCQLAIGLRSTQLLAAPNNRTVWRNDPRMALYFNTESQGGTTASTGNDELRQFLTEVTADASVLDSEESITYIATEIGKTLFGFLMRDVNVLDVRESFSSLGVDSLVSIELRNWFKQRLGCEITVLDILGSSSILALGEHTAHLLKTRITSAT
jgi:acyl carrier protein